MKSFRNNRRLLGAILLTIVCFAGSAAPAAAFERGSSYGEGDAGMFDRVVQSIQVGMSSLFDKLGLFWNAAGAVIED